VRGDTDRATAAELVAPAATELVDRAERATTMLDVHALAEELRRFPGVRGVSFTVANRPAPKAANTGRLDFTTTRTVGPPEWRQLLRVDLVDAEAHRQARAALDALADAAGRALRVPCRPVAEQSPPPPPLYRAITRHARALIVVIDPTRGWSPMSESFAGLLGYDRADPPVANLLDLVHPDDHPAAIGTFVTACGGTHPTGSIDMRLRTASGAWRQFEFAVRTFVGQPDAGVVAYFGLDVTTQRAAERALRVERGRLFSLVETLGDGILLIDEEQRVSVANRAFRRILGVEEPLRAGSDRGWARLLAQLEPLFAAGVTDAVRLRDIVAARRAVMGEEVELADGRAVELDFVPLESEGGPRGTLMHLRDVTSRVAVRRGLEERNRSLAEASAMNTQFVATVAHELRGPLSSVVAFAHLLGDASSGLLSDDQRQYLDVIDRNANRLLRLIEDLLLLARLEARTLQLRTGPVRLPDLVRTAVTERLPAAETAGLQLAVETADGPELTCDETRVHQVLDNLLNNALKFTPAGGSVTVRARPSASGWQVEVADSGVGIPAGELPRVFSAFFRGSNTAIGAGQPAPPGTGLGLVVSRAIVELHGGTIQVASTEGAGTTVTVSLPTRPAGAASGRTGAKPAVKRPRLETGPARRTNGGTS
jgi:PAS domain S-box-containing protein